MLGHLRPPLCRLPPLARNRYRLIYCSLCAALRRRFGLAASLLVNHELALTVMALCPEATPDWPGAPGTARCPARLLTARKPVWRHELFERAAEYCLLLAWLKAVDGVADQPAWHRRLARAWLGRRFACIAPGLAPETRDLVAAYGALAARPDAPFAEVEALSARLAAHVGEKLGRVTPSLHWADYLPLFAQVGGLIPRADHLLDFRRDRASGQYNPLLAAGVPPEQAYREAWIAYCAQATTLREALAGLPGVFAETAQAALAALSARIEREKNPVLGMRVDDDARKRKDRWQNCDTCCQCGDCGYDCCSVCNGCGRPGKSACASNDGHCCHGCDNCGGCDCSGP
jgi:hypothetical protein